MHQVAIVLRLQPDARERAERLLAGGPPFDPDLAGFQAHSVYLSATEVVFVFEGPEVELLVDEIVSDPPSELLAAAFDEWRDLADGPPRIARPVYAWAHEPA
jgi:hypothetical protein